MITIKTISEINDDTIEGQLLIQAIDIMWNQSPGHHSPNEILAEIVQSTNKVHRMMDYDNPPYVPLKNNDTTPGGII